VVGPSEKRSFSSQGNRRRKMADIYPRFVVAAVQAAAVLFDRDKTVDKAVRLIEEAGDKGAVIIGFPELFICGHPGPWYYAKKSNPLPDQGKMFTELVKNAVKVPSPATDRLCAAARKAHAYVVMGMSELDSQYPGTLYMSQLFISDKGEVIGVHRKLVTTIIEKMIYSCGDGSYLNVYNTPYGKLSAMMCGEHSHDLYKYALLAMGAQIHVASWPSAPGWSYAPALLTQKGQRDSIAFRIRAFAHAGKVFVINSKSITDSQNVTACADTEEERKKIVENTGGGSFIVGPYGQYLAGPVHEGEEVITAEISLEDSFAGRQIVDVLGHYTRWDVLSLNFNQERLSPIKQTKTPPSSALNLQLELADIKRKVDQIDKKLASVEVDLKDLQERGKEDK
jgi:aliphatic nitrilase